MPNETRLLKKHFIVYAMAFAGLNGDRRVDILREAHRLVHGDTRGFKETSNVDYFCDPTPGRYRYEKVKSISLISQGLVRRGNHNALLLTNEGRDLAYSVRAQIEDMLKDRDGVDRHDYWSQDDEDAKRAQEIKDYEEVMSRVRGEDQERLRAATAHVQPERDYRDLKDDAVRLVGKYMANGMKETPDLQAETMRLIGEVLSRL